MRSPEEIERVRELSIEHNKCEIARLTGIPRSTVSGWLNGRAPRFATDRTRGGSCLRCGSLGHPFAGAAVYGYAYLLGLYLGDGCLLQHPRGVYRLHVFLDSAYPVIAAECEAAMGLVMPSSRASCRPHPRWNMLNLVSYSTHWTSSATARTTSRGSSATRATGFESRGGRTGRGTSPLPAGTPSRPSIAMSGQRARRG